MSKVAHAFHDPADSQIGALREALMHFSETSLRLEERYSQLRAETEDLRRRLKEKDEEIARSARLATLGQTAAALAHEIRNPLGAIQLFASMLKQDLSDQEAPSRLVDHIQNSVQVLENTVSNILQFAHHREIPLTPINVHSIVRERVADARRLLPPSITVLTETTGNPFALGNEDALRRILNNLVTNAAQALSQRGTITIRCYESNEGLPCIEVRDNGPGIPPHLLTTVFEPFVTSRNEGTGLGLAIVRQLSTQLHATVDVHNQDGAVFSIRFKREQSDAKAAA